MKTYLGSPLFWGRANFDGEHYLAIARNGYSPLTYFFFPLYPLLINKIAQLFGSSQEIFLEIALIISNLSFFIGLVGLWKLIRLDWGESIARHTIVLFLLFPTSFFFVSVYTEGLFFCLAIWCFYMARQKKWLASGVLGLLCSATRLIGVGLLPAILLEFLLYKYPKKKLWKAIPIFLIPLGLIFYMFYLNNKTHDPLNFINEVQIYGEQRSSSLILLPQVLYRYVFKILPHLTYTYFPFTFTVLVEFFTGIVFLIFLLLSFYKMRLSYTVFFLISYLTPTLSGSFSSFSRYALVIFPAFIMLSLWLQKLSQTKRYSIYFLLLLLLGIANSLFLRGFWIA